MSGRLSYLFPLFCRSLGSWGKAGQICRRGARDSAAPGDKCSRMRGRPRKLNVVHRGTYSICFKMSQSITRTCVKIPTICAPEIGESAGSTCFERHFSFRESARTRYRVQSRGARIAHLRLNMRGRE